MKILGVDPGTAITGYACLENSPSGFRLITYGCIRTDSHLTIEKRIARIFEEFSGILEELNPDVVAVERQFFNRNVTNALLVGHASGVIILAAAQRNIPVRMYTPLQVKQAIAGYGKAEKKQIQFMVRNLLGLKKDPQPDDAADAIAVAICHANHGSFEDAVKRGI
jgi:crossover junction endodeoxyribonuclease RuvC